MILRWIVEEIIYASRTLFFPGEQSSMVKDYQRNSRAAGQEIEKTKRLIQTLKRIEMEALSRAMALREIVTSVVRTQVELNPSLESFKNLRAAGFERTIREQVKTSLRHLQTIELNPSFESFKNLWKRETRCIELMPLSQWSTKRNETYSSTRSVVHHSNPLRIFGRKTLRWMRRIERWV